MDATVVAKGRVEIRGGTLAVAKSKTTPKGRAPHIEVGTEPVVVGRSKSCGVVLDDAKVSAVHAEFVATSRGVRVRDLGSRNGVFVGDTRVGEVFLTKKSYISCGDTLLECVPTIPETVLYSNEPGFGPIVGASPGMLAVFERLTKVSPTDLTVLVTGETGTGKELVAHAIHRASDRAKRPFVVVDCGSIPTTLAESSLFGHERGSFTGAIDKRTSPFVEADGGTIFLDELGELPADVQPKLLRALSEQRIKAVGSNQYRTVNVRVIAATRRDLAREVNLGSFRSDLYFRVAQVRVELPPLRDRIGDIPQIVKSMLEDLGERRAFSRVMPDSLERLMRHDWPGNVRELRNVVAVALAFSKDGPIDLALPLSSMASSATESRATGGRTFQDAKREVLGRFEREYFTALHAECTGNVSEIARRCAMERAHVRGYLRRHGVGDVKARKS